MGVPGQSDLNQVRSCDRLYCTLTFATAYKHLGVYHAEHGYTTAIIEYRLSLPLAQVTPGTSQLLHPHHTLDCANALIWLFNNSKEYRFDPNKIVVVRPSLFVGFQANWFDRLVTLLELSWPASFALTNRLFNQ